MSKAMVIKNANFSENKLDTVTFSGVHTTSVELSASTITSSQIGSTHQLTASIFPLDTVDAASWSSSNTNVATVSQSGLVTVVGCGTCTITLTSGQYSATCSVTCSGVALTALGKYNNTMIYPSSPSNDITTIASYYVSKTYYEKVMAGLTLDTTETKLLIDYAMTTGTSADATLKADGSRPGSYTQIGWCVPTPLPKICTKVHVKQLAATVFGCFVLWYKKDVPSELCGGQYIASRKPTETWSGATSSGWPLETLTDNEFTVPAGYDSMTVMWVITDTANAAFAKFIDATEEQLAAFYVTCD